MTCVSVHLLSNLFVTWNMFIKYKHNQLDIHIFCTKMSFYHILFHDNRLQIFFGLCLLHGTCLKRLYFLMIKIKMTFTSFVMIKRLYPTLFHFFGCDNKLQFFYLSFFINNQTKFLIKRLKKSLHLFCTKVCLYPTFLDVTTTIFV